MACTKIPLADMEWAQGGHPLERKKAHPSGITLLEFAPGFEDANWCTNGHVIYVLQGRLALQLEDRVIELHSGEACVLDAGTRHRARNPDDTAARLFVVTPS
jgi:quercetin dioxygenase-like cupin family protein